MTRVEFFFNVADKLAKTAELCEKAVVKGRQITILSQDDVMSSALQQRLWQQSVTSFLPSAKSDDAMCQFSPIVLNTNGEEPLQDDILINLQAEHPAFFSRFRYLVELVGVDEADKVVARARYRFYRDRGYEVKSTDEAVN